jgi:hypothetical protein
MWRLFKKTMPIEVINKPTVSKHEVLGEEHSVNVDFDATIDKITALNGRQQATFLYKLVSKLDTKLLKTLKFYVQTKLKYGPKNIDLGQGLNNPKRSKASANSTTANNA